MAHKPAAGANNTGPDGAAVTRTCLLWEEEDMSKVGGHRYEEVLDLLGGYGYEEVLDFFDLPYI